MSVRVSQLACLSGLVSVFLVCSLPCRADLRQDAVKQQEQQEKPATKRYMKLAEQRVLIEKQLSTRNDLSMDSRIRLQKKITELDTEVIAGLTSGAKSFYDGSPKDRKIILDAFQNALIKDRFRLSQTYQSAGKYAEGVSEVERTIALSKSVLGDDHWRTREYHLKLGVAKWLKQADASKLADWKQCIEARRVANTALSKRDYAAAIESYDKIISKLKELKLTETMRFGEAVANQAEVFRRAGKPQQAEQAFEEAIRVNDKLFNKRSPTNANMRRSFGDFLRQNKKYEKALSILSEAEALFVATGKARSLELGYTLFLKGLCQIETNQDPAACKSLLRSHRMFSDLRQSRLSNLMGQVKTSLFKVFARTNAAKEDPAKIAVNAGAIADSIFKNDTESSAQWLALIAESLQQRNQSKDAIGVFSEARTRFEKLGDHKNRIDYIECLTNLAAASYRGGALDDAIEYAKQATNFAGKAKGRQSMFFAYRAQNLAVFLTIKGKHEEAEKVFAELIPVLKTNLGTRNAGFLRVLFDRAANDLKAGKIQQAIARLSEIKTLHEQMPNRSKADYLRVLQNLKSAYEKNGDQAKADQMQELIDKVRGQ